MELSSGLRRHVVALTAVATMAIGAVTAVTFAAPAAADPGPIAQRTADQMTADGLPTEQIDNGVVWAVAVSDDGIAYAGGNFSNVRPPGAAKGTNLTPRGNLVAINLRTGALVTSFAPSLNGQVKAVALSPDGSRLYVGGAFTTAGVVGGAQTSHSHIAAYSTATGQLINTFTASANSGVNALAVTDSTVYAGGVFSSAKGTPRARLAAFDATGGSLLGWAPTADNDVDALVMAPDNSRVIVAGAFANVNGALARGSAALDATTAASVSWTINQTVYSYNTNLGGAILSLSTDGTAIYGTAWNYGDPSNFEGTFSADPYTGNINWLEDCHGDTYGAFATNGAVYVVSHEHFCSNVGGFPDTNPRVWHRTTAFTTNATGTLTNNQEGGTGYGNFGGQPSPSMINWYPDIPAGTFTGQGQAAWSVSGNSQFIVEGGEFQTVNGAAQYGLVRFAVPALAPNKRGPQISGTSAAAAPSTLITSKSTVRISWQANWDQDDQNLTYSVYRYDKGTTTPVYQTTAVSQFWNLPVMGFTDTGLQAGTTYKYYLRVTDPSGNAQRSNDFSVTISPDFSVSQYAQDVLALSPTHYWRLDESAGTSTSTDWAGYNNLLEGSTVTNGASGAVIGDSDTAASFDGSATGVAGAQAKEAGPNAFSVGAWIKTTTNSGGKIVGFGDSQSGTSGNYDRHLYMDNAGHVVFGVYNNGIYTVTSQTTYNDGQWHQLVGTLSSSGMVLYIDGKKIGTNAGTVQGQPYNGYWRVGGDNLNAWPSRPSSNNFAGTVDEVAIYPSALTLPQVQQQYTDSGRGLAIAPPPTDKYGKAVYQDSPDLYYRLDDSAGTSAADASPNNVPGVYSGGVSFRTPSTVTGANGTGVTFNGSDGTLASQPYTNPTTYSEELWFNTTTNSGGKLIGFGNQQNGNSGNYDRHVYMGNSGQLYFGAYPNQVVTVTSPKSYNDGAWHYLVATQGADGMSLYVDGQLVASNSNAGSQGYTGYWRVGGDNLNGWTAQPSSAYFNGKIDEVAVYLTELSPAQIQAHYKASPDATDVPPNAAFTPSCTNLNCSFDGSASSDPDGSIASYAWDFGDGHTGTGENATHSYGGSGTFTVTLTVTDDQGATDQASADVSVTAPANQPPTASFTKSCTNLACSFDAGASSDPDGSIASYAWDFGDGTGTGQTATHTYSGAGTYTVTLTVTDNRGATDTASTTVTVAPNQPPTASFTDSCTNLVCSFDASASSDPDGSIADYAWNFGDGTSNTGATPSHTFASAGTYTVTLTVTDNQDSVGTTSQQLTVVGVPVYAADTFERTVASGWGTADTGGAYSLGGGTTRFAVTGGSGIMKLNAPGAGPYAYLDAVSATNINELIDATTDAQGTGNGISLVYIARHTTSGDYRLKLRLLAGGVVHLALSKVIGTTETLFKEIVVTGLTYNTGDVLRTRFTVGGTGTTTLTGKVWKVGAPEPASDQISTTDTTAVLQTAGSVGIYSYLAGNSTNAPVNVKYDNFAVSAL